MSIDHLEIGAPVGIPERGVREQRLGEAVDRGERGAQLVRGVRDEIAAHLLELHQLRHVVKYRHRSRARGAAGREAHGVHAQRAVRRVRHLDRMRYGLIGVVGGLEHFGELGVADRLERGAPAHLGGNAEEFAQTLVAEQDSLLRVHHEHAFDHSVQDRLQLVLLAQRDLCALAQLVGHPLQGRRDRAELVAETKRQPVAEVALRDRRRHAAHLADRPQRAAGQANGQQARRGEADGGGEQEVCDERSEIGVELRRVDREAHDRARVVADRHGHVEELAADARAAAAGAARAPGEGFPDLGSLRVITEIRELLDLRFGVAEHRPVAGDPGDARACRRCEPVGERIERGARGALEAQILGLDRDRSGLLLELALNACDLFAAQPALDEDARHGDHEEHQTHERGHELALALGHGPSGGVARQACRRGAHSANR